MNAWYSLILPFLIHLVIFLHGISETLTAGAKGAQYLSSPRISEVRQREKEWEMMGAARRSGGYSAESQQMRYNRMMERQMEQARSQTRQILF
jgi:hypothetical protein